MMEKQREKWLDSLKGLGIIFVVLGHCFPPQQLLTNYLYSFHIPLFFFISGYLISNQSISQKFSVYFNKRCKGLIMPYFGYGLFTYLVWLVIGRNFGVNKELAVAPLKPLLGLFYGNGFDNYLVFNIAIWFLPALFSALILYYWVRRTFQNRFIIFGVIILSLLVGYLDSKYLKFRLPWGINISLVAIIFLHLGYLSKALFIKYWQEKTLSSIELGLFFLVLGYFGQDMNSGVSFNSHSYGNIFYFILAASSSIFAYAILTKQILDNRVMQFLGKNSLKILALHILSFSFISAFIKFGLGGDFLSFKITLIGRLTYFLSSIALLSLYSIIIDQLSKKNRLFSRLSVIIKSSKNDKTSSEK